MRVIFLDIDGVLNSDDYAERQIAKGIKQELNPIDPDALKRMLRICKDTDAKIIISSGWRGMEYKHTIENLKTSNPLLIPLTKYVIGITPRLNCDRRGTEINYILCRWKDAIERGLIDENYKDEKIDSFVIIDDDVDMLTIHKYNFINTNFQTGLTEEDARHATELLLGGKEIIYDLKAKDWVKYHENDKKYENPEDIPEIPNLGKQYTDKYFAPLLINHGAIPLDQLEIGKTYIGTCRNTSKATWTGDHFIYLRNKFGFKYNDSINHFQQDDGYDVFIPIKVYEE